MGGFRSSQAFLGWCVLSCKILENQPVGLTSFPALAGADDAIRIGKSNSKDLPWPSSLGHARFGHDVPCRLGGNPLVSRLEPRAERSARLPAELLPDQPVVGVPASHALRSRHVILANPLAGDIRHQ